MKWNQSKIKGAMPKIAKQAGLRDFDFEGKTADDFVAYMKKVDEAGVLVEGLDTEEAQRRAFKTVFITADAGEDVQVVEAPGDVQTEELDPDDEDETKAEDDEDLKPKHYTPRRTGVKGRVPHLNQLMNAAGTGRTAGAVDRSMARKRYDRKAARGETAFSCSDAAEIANAWFRVNWLKNTNSADYEWKKYDLDILGKAGSVYDNTLGGFLVPEGVSAEMIELKAQFGIARQISGFESMPLPKWGVNRFGDDVVVYKTAEGIPMTDSDMTFSQVELLSQELGALSLFSNRLLNLSPIDLGDKFGQSAARGFGKYEDDSFFNGANGFQGIESKIGANSTHKVTGASKWASITIDDLLLWKSKLPAFTDQFSSEEIPITCTRPVFEQVFRKYALAQGGASVDDMLKAGELRFDGHPIILNNSTARKFVNNAYAAYIGPFSKVTKFGELEGAARVDSSDQRHFEKNQMAMRALEEIAINCHDVNNLVDSDGNTTSGVIALQVGT